MTKYPKINSVFKRDDNGNFTSVFTQPEFEYLFYNTWIGYEKIDGMNCRVGCDGSDVYFAGRTDKAQLQSELLEHLQKTFSPELFQEVFVPNEEEFPDIILYGEGYGAGIQKGGGNYRQGQGFILFDVKVNGVWLKREDVCGIAYRMGIPVVPIVFKCTLIEAIEFAKEGYDSFVAEGQRRAEGLVLKPEVDLLDRRGHRIITKLKEKDFK